MTQHLNNKKFLFHWRELVLSDLGPRQSSTRFVLHVLSTFMNPNKEMVSFVGVKKISDRTRLCQKTVRNSLRIALDEGWICRRKRTTSCTVWTYEYSAIIPKGMESNALPSVEGMESLSQGTELDSEGMESLSEGVEEFSTRNGTSCNQVVIESSLSSILSSSNSSNSSSGRRNKNKKHSIPVDWSPDVKFKNWALKNKLHENFYLPLIDEFIIYWSERGDKRPGWTSTFIKHVKRKREQQNENSKKYSGKYSAFDEATASAFEPD